MEKGRHKTEVKILIIALSILAIIILILIITNLLVLFADDISINSLGSDNLAKDCLRSEDVMSCLYEKAYYYYENEHDCKKALKVYDDIPAERFDEYELSDFYNDAYSMSTSCDDESLEKYWEQKFNNLSNRLEGRD